MVLAVKPHERRHVLRHLRQSVGGKRLVLRVARLPFLGSESVAKRSPRGPERSEDQLPAERFSSLETPANRRIGGFEPPRPLPRPNGSLPPSPPAVPSAGLYPRLQTDSTGSGRVHPILGHFELGGHVVTLSAYSTFHVLAWLVALCLGTFIAWRRRLSWYRALATFMSALAAGLVGARLLDIVTGWSYYTEQFDRIYSLSFTGFSLYGGLPAALLVGALVARHLGLSVWRLADSAVPAIVAGLVLMRVGCLLEGCCFGTVTSLPWGIEYAAGSPAWALQFAAGEIGIIGPGSVARPVHPTQVYEMLGAVAFGALAIWLMLQRDASGRRRHSDGVPFLVFALGFTLFRVGNGFLRESIPGVAAPAWFYPVLYATVCAVVVACLWKRTTNQRLKV